MAFPVLDQLNMIIGILRSDFVTIGLTLCGLVGAIAIIGILLNRDSSAAGRAQRWERLILTFICMALLSGLMVLLGVAQSVGQNLQILK